MKSVRCWTEDGRLFAVSVAALICAWLMLFTLVDAAAAQLAPPIAHTEQSGVIHDHNINYPDITDVAEGRDVVFSPLGKLTKIGETVVAVAVVLDRNKSQLSTEDDRYAGVTNENIIAIYYLSLRESPTGNIEYERPVRVE